MLNTRETDYALRMLRAVNEDKPTPMKGLSTEHDIPMEFAYKISAKLQQAGWIDVLRGKNGGCLLKADLSELTMLDLMNALQRPPLISPCLAAGYHCEWIQEHGEICTFHDEFVRMQKAMEEAMQEKTLEQIINQKTRV